MVPLQVTATLRKPIALKNPIALDGLLGAAICSRDGIPPALNEAQCVPLPIPVAKSACGRIYLTTVSVPSEVLFRHRRQVNKRFPIAEAQWMGAASVRRILISGGPCKSYRIPLETQSIREFRWWCIGDEDEIRALLTDEIGYLGAHRGRGLGAIHRTDAEGSAAGWTVERCEPWGDGFPVVRDGEPMRALPVDWPGLRPDVERAYRVMLPPFWRRSQEELCAVPRWT